MAYACMPAPAPLAGMCLPSSTIDWQEWWNAGFRWIVCLYSEQPRYNPAPVEFLARVELDDLCGGGRPSAPAREEKSIKAVASTILAKLRKGEGVIVHCVGGRGRTGTVLGVVLVQLGYQPEEVITALDRFHKGQGKPGWPESPWQSKVVKSSYGTLG